MRDRFEAQICASEALRSNTLGYHKVHCMDFISVVGISR